MSVTIILTISVFRPSKRCYFRFHHRFCVWNPLTSRYISVFRHKNWSISDIRKIEPPPHTFYTSKTCFKGNAFNISRPMTLYSFNPSPPACKLSHKCSSTLPIWTPLQACNARFSILLAFLNFRICSNRLIAGGFGQRLFLWFRSVPLLYFLAENIYNYFHSKVFEPLSDIYIMHAIL